MVRTVGIGIQSFEKVMVNHCFYVDKTHFIKEWWENQDDVTLIARPRRFGKTLNMSMLECFFAVQCKDKWPIFENLSIWKEEEYRQIQGTFPVISLSFANIKENTFEQAKQRIGQLIAEIYLDHHFLLDSEKLVALEKKNIQKNMENPDPVMALNQLSKYLFKHYGKRVIILLDEYDTPLQEAYIHGYWKEFTGFIRSLFNSTFKTNPYLERALMTGITRISKESIFSDLNNLEVVTTTSEKYRTSFGFTELEVADALEQFDLKENLPKVRQWYDGFCFGSQKNIYNPWSITKYLDTGKFDTYWANTSSNRLVGKLIREGASEVKTAVEDLLNGKSVDTVLDEEIVFSQLEDSSEAIWSLFLASGYLKVESITETSDEEDPVYHLSLTNLEVRKEFRRMIQSWFKNPSVRYNDFIRALLENNVGYMNQYMNQMAKVMFSFFDSGNKPSAQSEPERFHSVEATTKGLKEPNPSICFFHGFVLGLIADAKLDYQITSNRESGLGRYDVIMEPRNAEADAYIFEFKVKSPEEGSLEDTAQNALQQIHEKNYDTVLLDRGISKERIRHYGFAFAGKDVLICGEEKW